MYDLGYTNNYYGVANSVNGLLIWTIISLILAIGGGITLYIIFVKNGKKFKGFLGWMHEFLNFKKLLIEDILKISYLIGTLFITLYSFGLIGTSVIAFFAMLIFGNLILRVVYELSILIIKICKNTTEINNKLDKK